MPRTWVYSLYRQMGLTRRMGTTSHPPVPRGLYEECRFEYLRDVKEAVVKHSKLLDEIVNPYTVVTVNLAGSNFRDSL